MEILSNKIAIITGAANGIGYATAEAFAGAGAYVIAVDFRKDDLAKWNDAENVLPLFADVRNADDVKRMVLEADTRFGRLDVVCNIAGINDLCYPLSETDDDRWDNIHETDLKAPFRICREAIPLMLKSGGGSIVNVGSYAAVRGNHGPSYSAAKAGLTGLSRSIAVEYGKQGIRCNVVNPGGTRTNIVEHSGGVMHPAGQSLSKIVSAMPVDWYMAPEDIANACLFLCSDAAARINGAVLAVDGGMACC